MTLRHILAIVVLFGACANEARAQMKWTTSPKTGTTAGGYIYLAGNVDTTKINCTKVTLYMWINGGAFPDSITILNLDKNGNFGGADLLAPAPSTLYAIEVVAVDTKTSKQYKSIGSATSSAK
jgi:hypothetical protein